MIVRRYKGSSLDKLRDIVIKEMGENAVIIHTKKIADKGLLGKFGKGEYELVAAVEDSLSPGETAKLFSPVNEMLADQKNQYTGLRMSIKMLDDKLVDLEGKLEQTQIPKKAPVQIQVSQTPKEIPELKNIHKNWQKKIQEKVEEVSNGNPKKQDWVNALSEEINTAEGILFRRRPVDRPDLYVLVGPTGVGKTTTLAKLAAKAVLNEKLKVGFITIDTFRVGAAEQLKAYAELLGVEMKIAFSSNEYASYLDYFSDKDVVFVDTQGRGSFDEKGISGISEIISVGNNSNVLLTLQASTRKEDMLAISKGFKKLSPSCLILTKTDEGCRFDGLTTIFEAFHIPVVYSTCGQRVPEDIESASPLNLAGMILESNMMQRQKENTYA